MLKSTFLKNSVTPWPPSTAPWPTYHTHYHTQHKWPTRRLCYRRVVLDFGARYRWFGPGWSWCDQIDVVVRWNKYFFKSKPVKMLASPTLQTQSPVLSQVSNTSDFVVLRAVTQHAVLCCVFSIWAKKIALTLCYKHNTRPSCCVICVTRVMPNPD